MRSPPFFIVGSGRSGTTLTRLILASHSKLSIPPETWYLNRLTEFLEIDEPLRPDQVDRVVSTIVNHNRWQDLKLAADEYRRDVGRMKFPHFRDIVEWVYLRFLAREGKQRWGDKTPGYIMFVPQLLRLFPGAKFVEVIRDGRDVAKSFQVMRWHGPRLYENAHEWLEAMEFSARWTPGPLSQNILQIRYEDLVLDSENSVRRICEFLGEDYEPAMLHWPKELDDFIPARGAEMHRKLARMPEAGDVARWKRELSDGEIFVCEAFMNPYLRRHGYELKYDGPFWKSLFPITRWYCRRVLPLLSIPARAARKAIRIVRRNRAGSGKSIAAIES